MVLDGIGGSRRRIEPMNETQLAITSTVDVSFGPLGQGWEIKSPVFFDHLAQDVRRHHLN
jgi:hypothetical protein